MILLLFLFFTTAFAQESSLETLVRQVIAATNKANLENHRDTLEISGFKYNDYVDLEVGKISFSNFSTIALKGTPEVKKVEEDGISYYFNLAVGLDVLQLKFEYKFSSMIFSSSGSLKMTNTGNALRARGVVNTFSGKKPCKSVLQTIEVDSFGNLDVEFEKSGVLNWILGRLIKFGYGIGESYIRPMINQMVADKVKASEFQTMFSELACSVFSM